MLNFIKYLYKSQVIFSILTFPIRVLDFLFMGKRNEIVFYGYRGRYNGNAKALYEYYLDLDTDLTPVWLLDKEDEKSVVSKQYSYSMPSKKSSFIEHVKLLFKLYKAKVIVVTSVGDLHIYRMLLCKNKHKEILLPHGITLKSNGIIAKHLNKEQNNIWKTIPQRFDIISATSKIEQYWLSAGFLFDPNKVKIMGPQRSDNQIINISSIDKLNLKKELLKQANIDIEVCSNTKFMLYAPTHRDHKVVEYNFSLLENINGFDLEALDKKLIETKTILFLREHMVSSNFSSKNNLSHLKNIYFLTPIKLPEVESYMLCFDSIITDYSGIYLEWLKTDISLAFIPFDLTEYKEKRGLSLPESIMYPGTQIFSQNDFYTYLLNREQLEEGFKKDRENLHSLLFEVNKGESCKLTELEIRRLLKND